MAKKNNAEYVTKSLNNAFATIDRIDQFRDTADHIRDPRMRKRYRDKVRFARQQVARTGLPASNTYIGKSGDPEALRRRGLHQKRGGRAIETTGYGAMGAGIVSGKLMPFRSTKHAGAIVADGYKAGRSLGRDLSYSPPRSMVSGLNAALAASKGKKRALLAAPLVLGGASTIGVGSMMRQKGKDNMTYANRIDRNRRKSLAKAYDPNSRSGWKTVDYHDRKAAKGRKRVKQGLGVGTAGALVGSHAAKRGSDTWKRLSYINSMRGKAFTNKEALKEGANALRRNPAAATALLGGAAVGTGLGMVGYGAARNAHHSRAANARRRYNHNKRRGVAKALKRSGVDIFAKAGAAMVHVPKMPKMPTTPGISGVSKPKVGAPQTVTGRVLPSNEVAKPKKPGFKLPSAKTIGAGAAGVGVGATGATATNRKPRNTYGSPTQMGAGSRF